jgi:hypothetical protein
MIVMSSVVETSLAPSAPRDCFARACFVFKLNYGFEEIAAGLSV